MKIDEPPTPYSYADGSEGEESSSSAATLDPEALAKKVKDVQARAASIEEIDEEEEEGSEDGEACELTAEEKVKRKDFEMKRKSHYNEFQAVKLARQLLSEEEDDEEDDTPVATTEATSSDTSTNGNDPAALQADTPAESTSEL